MPRVAPRRSADPPPLSASAQLIGLSAYALCLLLGFGFGLWAGSRPPRPTEVARAHAPTSPADAKPAEARPAEPPPAAKAPDKPAPSPALDPLAAKKEVPKPEPSKKGPPRPTEAKKPAPKRVEPKPEPPPAPAANVTFARDVVPVFRSHCLTCHGAPSIKGGLDLRNLAAVMRGGETGAAVKPGDPANSLIWTQIEAGEMPPAGKPRLSDAEKRLIRDWILGGAK